MKNPKFNSIRRYIIITLNIIFLNSTIWSYYPLREGLSMASVTFILLSVSGLFFLFLASWTSIKRGALKSILPNVRMRWSWLMIWNFFIIICSFQLDYRMMLTLFTVPDLAGAWIIPISMVIGTQFLNWRTLYKIFLFHTCIGVILGTLGIILGITNRSLFSLLNGQMLYASGILPILSIGRSKFGLLIGIWGLFLFGVDNFLSGIRGAMANFVFYTAMIVFVILAKRRVAIKRLILFVIILTISNFLLVRFIAYITSPTIYQDEVHRTLKKLPTDSRSTLIEDFFNSTKGFNLWFGRGAIGSYESEIMGTERRNIEVGYLQLILKGGILMVILFLITVLPIGLRAIFASNNWFTRCCGFIIIGRLLYMCVGGIPWVELSYIVFWFAVGVCMNPRLRKASDAELDHSWS